MSKNYNIRVVQHLRTAFAFTFSTSVTAMMLVGLLRTIMRQLFRN